MNFTATLMTEKIKQIAYFEPLSSSFANMRVFLRVFLPK